MWKVPLQKVEEGNILENIKSKEKYFSRPVVRYHLKILKDAGNVNMRHIGTKNYYYVDSQIMQIMTILL